MSRLICILFVVTLAGCQEQQPPAAPVPLNFLVIVADDLGYTDLGAFGGEINTPHLDQLALDGLRLTNFHTAPSCAPTRAMLLTGTDNHVVGMGSQSGLVTPAQAQLPGYRSALLPQYPTIAELLGQHGYRSYAVAKWHVGSQADALPGARGFDRSFVLLEGGAGHFDDTPLFAHYEASWLEDDQRVQLPESFYSSDELTNRLISYIKDDPDQPFFAYLGFTAPHWPLQAPPADIARYTGQYDAGWSALHKQRMAGAKGKGVIPPDAQGVAYEAGVQSWSELGAREKQVGARTMEVYAAMVDRLDQNVGRLLQYLENEDLLQHTVIVFLSDNGAEAHRMEVRANRDGWIDQHFDSSLQALGSAASYVTLGPGWARATAAPFRASKSKISEGGIRVPAFVSLPEHRVHASGGAVDDSYHRVMDLLPTLYQAAGGDQLPDSVGGRSQWARWQGGASPVYQGATVAAELYGRRMAQRDNWKILLQEAPYGTGEWQLYNLADDPGEQRDLSDQHPELRAQLIESWNEYAAETGVLLPEHPIPY